MDEVLAGESSAGGLRGLSRSRRRFLRGRLLTSLFRRWTAVMGLFIVISAIVLAFTAPWVAPHDPFKQNLQVRLQPPAWVEGGSWANPLGTDQLGRDLLSRIIYGTRLSLVVGVTAVLASSVIGTAAGIVAGYYRGWIDDVIGRVIDVQLAIPYLLLAIALMMALGSSLRNLILVLILNGWTVYARLARAATLSMREQEFVISARAVGAATPRIFGRYILPNIINSIIVMMALEMANMIIFEAGLSFLGLGAQTSMPSWGSMLADGRSYVPAGIWWPATFPGLAISILILGINEVGDWLRDVLDPRLRV